MTKQVLEEATGCQLIVPKSKTAARAQCACLLGDDIGMYNTCGHGCLYCYANFDNHTVRTNMSRHDPDSPFLIGNYQQDDIIIDVDQILDKPPVNIVLEIPKSHLHCDQMALLLCKMQ